MAVDASAQALTDVAQHVVDDPDTPLAEDDLSYPLFRRRHAAIRFELRALYEAGGEADVIALSRVLRAGPFRKALYRESVMNVASAFAYNVTEARDLSRLRALVSAAGFLEPTISAHSRLRARRIVCERHGGTPRAQARL
ncbi:hypothetical protein SAMN05444370_1651 [Rubrimonas cliftonensis]|uniref:Uncharacterized protein n=2 Tax=Rubrimonas cliftonensis TaxID=89524 RepID=A0A1H4GHA0_9RHOB|nr:hypothetical protein SAMN05444370_1651 [Rubrimonas cliftonensis]